MNVEWLSRFAVLDVDVTLATPFRPHIPDSPSVGGSRDSAAGVMAAYVVREDEIVRITYRLYEEEYVLLRSVLRHGRKAEIITFWPDEADEDQSFQVWLHSPRAGQPFGTERGDPNHMYEITIELRRVDGEPWDFKYFTQVGI
jgi:hypothetical protein